MYPRKHMCRHETQQEEYNMACGKCGKKTKKKAVKKKVVKKKKK